MHRRELVLGLAGSVVLVSAPRARADDLPLVGFLRSTAAAPFEQLAEAFREGLKGTGFVEKKTVSILYRYADGHRERLPELAAELIAAGVAVIAGNSQAAEAAKRLTATVPIVFVTSDDPVARGLVASLSHPGGNATGFTFFGGGQLAAKRLAILHELVPAGSVIGFLMDPNWPGSAVDLVDAQTAAGMLGHRLAVAKAAAPGELDAAFASLKKAGAAALIVAGAPSFSSHRRRLIELSGRLSLPTIYDLRDYVVEGGLLSYAGSLTDAYRHAGAYVGKILKGASPAALPVQRPAKIELAVNLKTAGALGLTVPPVILAQADEVIE